MDEIVLKGMARWPNVPAVYGWLGLDRRGNWKLRGEPLNHPAANRFINRNYAQDDTGSWYFQNGPQRVFVELEYTPWVYRLDLKEGFQTHTGVSVTCPEQVYMDEDGAVLVKTELGIGLLDDRDLALFCDALCGVAGDNLDDVVIDAALMALADGEVCAQTQLSFNFLGGRSTAAADSAGTKLLQSLILWRSQTESWCRLVGLSDLAEALRRRELGGYF